MGGDLQPIDGTCNALRKAGRSSISAMANGTGVDGADEWSVQVKRTAFCVEEEDGNGWL